MIAVEKNILPVVEILIISYKFKVNETINDESAISIAMHGQYYDIVEMLLKHNSMFPKNIKNVSNPAIKKIIDTCPNLHQLITDHSKNNSKISEIAKIFDDNLTMRHFFNIENQSAAFFAIKSSKLDIYELLASKNIVIGPNERISDAINDFKEFEKIYKINKKYTERQYLYNLIQNSFPVLDDPFLIFRLTLITEAFECLDEIRQIKPYLELVSNSGKFKIIFDFNRESTDFLVPGSRARGMFKDTTICVAAKRLLHEKTILEALGILAHELCHFAMYLVYRNGLKPYKVGDVEAKANFLLIVKACELKKEEEDIIKRVFSYDREKWEYELIVRIPQMLAHYLYNPGKIKFLRDTYDPLFEYFETVVLPDVIKAIPLIKRITNDPNSITWKDLTPQLQSVVKNKPINLMGNKLTFCDIFDQNPASYEKLSSERIMTLVKPDKIVIESIKNDIKFFVKTELLPNYNVDVKDVKVTNFKKKMLIPSYHIPSNSGAKMTTVSPEKEYKRLRMWIHFGDLKKYFEEFDEFNKGRLKENEIIASFLDSFQLSFFKKPKSSQFLKIYFKNVNRKLSKELLNQKVEVTEKFIASIKERNSWSRWRGKTIVNHLFLLFIADYDEIDTTKNINFYLMVESFVMKKLKIVLNEALALSNDQINSMNLMQIHQVYALELIYGKEKTSNLDIMKMKNKYSNKDINSIKILYLESNGMFRFDHRIFAEYFCAVYFIDGIFNCNDQPTKEEANLRLELLLSADTKWQSKVRSLIINFLDSKPNSIDFHEIYKNLMLNEHKQILTKLSDKSSSLNIFLLRFFQKSQSIIETIWNLTDLSFLLSMRKLHTVTVVDIIVPFLNVENQHNFINACINNEYYIYSSWTQSNRFNQGLNQLKQFGCNLLEFIKNEDVSLPHKEFLIDFLNFIEIILRKKGKKNSASITIEKITEDNISQEKNILSLFINTKEENIYEFFFTMIEKNNENSKIYDFLLEPHAFKDSCLIILIMTNNEKSFRSFSIFFEKNFNRYTRKKILMHRNFHGQTALHFIILNGYSNVEELVKKTYKAHFSTDELIEILKKDLVQESLLSDMISNVNLSLNQIEKFMDFILNLFEEKEEEFLDFLCYEKHEIHRNVNEFKCENAHEKILYFQSLFKKWENKNKMYIHSVFSSFKDNY